jgi:hypothetical protein
MSSIHAWVTVWVYGWTSDVRLVIGRSDMGMPRDVPAVIAAARRLMRERM